MSRKAGKLFSVDSSACVVVDDVLFKWCPALWNRGDIANLPAPEPQPGMYGRSGMKPEDLRRMPVVIGGILYEVDVIKTGWYRLWKRGQISEPAFCAADAFSREFSRCGYARMKTTNMSGAGGGGKDIVDIYHDGKAARDYVHNVITLLGGPRCYSAIAVVQFCGYETKIEDMPTAASGVMPGDSRMNRHNWQGILLAGLQQMGDDWERMTRGQRGRGRLYFDGERPSKMPDDELIDGV